MKGEKLLKILEVVAGAGEGMIGFFEAFTRAGYGASAYWIAHTQDKLACERETRRREEKEEQKECERFRNMLRYLESCGLVKKDKIYGGKWKITDQGKNKIEKIRTKKFKNGLTPSILDYERKAGKQLVIVAFDIPEKERSKRDWLRAVLGHLGFKMLQKSVWIGKVEIPQELPGDLKALGLMKAVEILTISKAGNLRHLV